MLHNMFSMLPSALTGAHHVIIGVSVGRGLICPRVSGGYKAATLTWVWLVTEIMSLVLGCISVQLDICTCFLKARRAALGRAVQATTCALLTGYPH